MTEIPSPNPRYVVPDLAEFISRRMRDVSAGLNAVLIGTVQSVNTNQTITVSVNFLKVIKAVNAIAGNPVAGATDQVQQYPTLVNVPYFIYQGGGAFIQMPIAQGDPCILLFCDRDMDTWLQTNQVNQPNSDRVHNINDAIALVGINSLQSLLPLVASSIINIVDSTGSRLPPSGAMMAYGGATAPSGWLLCQGQSLKRTDYPLLFAVIGTTYGSVDGTHFTLPNMQGQVPVGYKSGDPYFGTLGGEYGEETHTLTTNEMPAHTHPMGGERAVQSGSSQSNMIEDIDSVGSPTTGSTGGGAAHNNIQPSLVVNFIIKI